MTERIPPEAWIVEEPFDWTEWGLRPAPTYEDDEELVGGTDAAFPDGDPGDDFVSDR